jgi:carboxyl-terminal processing protease
MRQPRIVSPLLIGGLLGSFTLGLSFPEVLAGAQGQQLAQGGLPEAYAPVHESRSGHGSLEPLGAYYRTLSYLKDRYYGDLESDTKLTYAAIRGMLRPLDDPFTRFLDPKQYGAMREKNQGGYAGIGALLDPVLTRDGYVRIHAAQRGTRADRAGLKPFDVILKVNGVSARNKNMEQVAKMIRGQEGTPVWLTIRRRAAARPLEVRILRQMVELPTIESGMREGRVGLIRLSEFNELSDMQIDRALTHLEQQGMRALVLDLRGNPGGTLDAAQEIASRFLPNGKDVVIIREKDSEPEIRKVLEEKHNHRFNLPGHPIPLVVLVNRSSASASEIVAGAIKDNHAGIIMGTQTYGKGLVQTVVPLRGGSAIAITSAHYLTPNGSDINRGQDRRGGIAPDVVVEATEENWIKQNDVQLKKALELLHERIGYKRLPAATQLTQRRPAAPNSRSHRKRDAAAARRSRLIERVTRKQEAPAPAG